MKGCEVGPQFTDTASIVGPSAFLYALENLVAGYRFPERDTRNIKRRRFLWLRRQNKTLPIAPLNPHRPVTTRLFKDGSKVLSRFRKGIALHF